MQQEQLWIANARTRGGVRNSTEAAEIKRLKYHGKIDAEPFDQAVHVLDTVFCTPIEPQVVLRAGVWPWQPCQQQIVASLPTAVRLPGIEFEMAGRSTAKVAAVPLPAHFDIFWHP